MPSNSSTSSSKPWPKAFLLAAAAVVALRVLELLVLPINFFTFRAWEALIVRRLYFALPGPFYPESRLDMIEEGDLAPRTALAVKKRVEFVTDRWGFRKRPAEDDRWDVVIVGDSFAAGATLTQDDTLSVMLESRLKRRVYPLAPASLDWFLASPRFSARSPKAVVFEFAETGIPRRVPADAGDYGAASTAAQRFLREILRPFPRLAVLADRWDKGIVYENASAKIKRLLKGVPAGGGPRMLFRGDTGVLASQVAEIAAWIEADRAAVEKRGMRFLFLPVPDKETIYFDLQPGAAKPDGLALLIAKLKADGVEVVDLLSAFEAARKKDPGNTLYHTDDSHWNPRGVAVAAELLARTLSQ